MAALVRHAPFRITLVATEGTVTHFATCCAAMFEETAVSVQKEGFGSSVGKAMEERHVELEGGRERGCGERQGERKR